MLQILITVYGCQTLNGSHQRTFPIRFDTTAFQHERLHISGHHLVGEGLHMTKITGNQIIMIGDELHSPAIEHEIIKHGRSLIEDGNSPVIPCPRIVRIHLTENDTVVINLTQLFTYGGLVRTDNQ